MPSLRLMIFFYTPICKAISEIDELYPWEQRDDEPDHAYHAFRHGWRDQKLDDPNARRTMTEA